MFNLSRFKSSIEARNKASRAAYRQIDKYGKDFILASFKKLFEKYPKLKAFSWEQGQYYNDETYDFRCNTDYISINGIDHATLEDREALADLGLGTENGTDPDFNDWADEAAEEISDILNFLNENDYEKMFGEAKVVVTRDEIKIEEFQGDY
jgi:hypothetical protein